MGDLIELEPADKGIQEKLKERLQDAQSGELDGLVMISVYKTGRVTTTLEGAFSPDPDDLAKIIGYLNLTILDLYAIATEECGYDE